MERNEILERITPIFQQVFNDNTLVLTEDMEKDDFDNWDSVTQMMLVAMIEKDFCITFKLREVGMLNSIGDFLRAVESKL